MKDNATMTKLRSHEDRASYFIGTMLSRTAAQHIEKLQNQLTRLIGNDIVWCMPTAALHMTLCEIAKQKTSTLPIPEVIALRKQSDIVALSQILANQPPITLHFTHIEASDAAIIIRAKPIDAFKKLRNEIVASLPVPPETKRPPQIVHATIARYNKVHNLTAIQANIARLSIDFSETISIFELFYNIESPMLRYKVLNNFEL